MKYIFCEYNHVERVKKGRSMEEGGIEPDLKSPNSSFYYFVEFNFDKQKIKIKSKDTSGHNTKKFLKKWIPFAIYDHKQKYYMNEFFYDPWG